MYSVRAAFFDILSKDGQPETDLETRLTKYLNEVDTTGKVHYKMIVDGFVGTLCSPNCRESDIVTKSIDKIDCPKCLYFLMGDDSFLDLKPLH